MVRAHSESLCEPLAVEDFGVQPMADASPPKWHLAHTSWFFETFILKPFADRYAPYHPRFEYLFNSYYNGVGEPYPRARRGLLSRPTVAEVFDYRRWVDEQVLELLHKPVVDAEVWARLELGLHHEQQHQELLLTDLKYNLGHNPLLPAYRERPAPAAGTAQPVELIAFPGGEVEIGASLEAGFCFDNEQPRHRRLLAPFALANRPVSNGEYQAFVDAGGYRLPELWLSDGWAWLQQTSITRPLYWLEDGSEYTLLGVRERDPAVPVVHVSYYEADAFARWAGCRLPGEDEWEHAASGQACRGNFYDGGRLHPRAADGGQGPLDQLFGDVWEWTASSYGPYPRYRPLPGTLGEYNGKFMSNQLVLRGGSSATPSGHLRHSYRNFFYPADRWQFSGIRLAQDA